MTAYDADYASSAQDDDCFTLIRAFHISNETAAAVYISQWHVFSGIPG
jgi:hypothetical protein